MDSSFAANLFEGYGVLVTGGGSGIGLSIAAAFAAAGAHVGIMGRNAERLEQAASAIRQASGSCCVTLPADVRDPEAVNEAVARFRSEVHRIDVLICAAAGNFLVPAANLTPKGLRTVLDIDTVGTFVTARSVFDAGMSEHGGCIINISATLHYATTPLQLHACAAKAGVDAITRSLAVEWGPLGIRVNGIAPGPVEDTEGLKRLAPGDYAQRLTARIPLRRMARRDEIAQVALFLASPAASYVTGHTLVVDGGQWLAGYPEMP